MRRKLGDDEPLNHWEDSSDLCKLLQEEKSRGEGSPLSFKGRL